MPDGNGVAQRNMLEDGCIFRLFPKRFKSDGQCGRFHTERIVLQIFYGTLTEHLLRYCGTVGKGIREIPDQCFSPCRILRNNREQLFPECNHGFCAVLGGRYRIGEKIRVNFTGIRIVFQFCQVFSVFDDNACIDSASSVMDDPVIVPFELTAPKIHQRAFRTAEHSSQTFRSVHRERFRFRIIGAEGKTVRNRCIFKFLFNGKLRGSRCTASERCRNAGQVIGDMLCVYGNNSVYGCCDAVNAEGLVGGGVVRFYFYDALVSQFRIVSTACRILEDALVSSVSFFRDFAGNGIRKRTDAVSGKVRGIRFEKNRYHTVAHLGMISTPVILPSKETVFSPGYRRGNPSPVTVSFFASVS